MAKETESAGKPTNNEELLAKALAGIEDLKKVNDQQAKTIATLTAKLANAGAAEGVEGVDRPVTRHTLNRIRQIKADAKARPQPTNHVETGYAIIKDRAGKKRRMIELSAVMGHTCEIEFDGQTGDARVRAGGRWDELIEGLFILEQYAPYPKAAIVNGFPTYYNPQDMQYDEVDGVLYHPTLGKEQRLAYQKSKGKKVDGEEAAA